ncbi:MAG: M23 family metallopeptidase [Clostridia bacterium]|nr:M23 family metallopeptidase [Clostridia bacterium]
MKIKPIRPKKSRTISKKPEKSNVIGSKNSVERVNRTVYLTVAVLLVVLAVAVAMTSAANKSKRGAVTTDNGAETSVPAAGTSPTETITPNSGRDEGTAPVTTQASTPDTEKVPVIETVPLLSLPASGSLGTGHDPTIQVFSDTLGEWRVHLGIDIMTEAGAPVCAAADGKIISVTDEPLYGTCVAVEHSGGAVTVYKNLSDTVPDGIKTGKTVKSGQLIGSVGEGCVMELSEDPHLHFEMTVNGEPVNPLEYFSSGALSTLKTASDTAYEG